MNGGFARALLFVAALVGVFGVAFGAGRLAGPDTAPAAAHDDGHSHSHASTAPVEVHLSLEQRSFAPGRRSVSFQVQDRDGRPVTSYDVQHEKELHLIVLDTRELRQFQHVHPMRAADGTWTAQLELQPGTPYRIYADGSTAGHDFVATAELWTTGHGPSPRDLPAPTTTERVDGFAVQLVHEADTTRVEVTRDGQPVELEPYLGALGHLVVIRVDDLSYLHVHPGQGTTPEFLVSGLAPGQYRYFFDFQVDGVVHTASFTVDRHREETANGSGAHSDDH